jgi:di/tricarboxylate transporter
MQENDLRAFGMFAYTPLGFALTIVGVFFMALMGRHLLPERNLAKDVDGSSAEELSDLYDLGQRLFLLRLPENTTLDGQTLSQSRIGAILGVNVTAIIRDGQFNLAPQPEDVLRGGDKLLVTGRVDGLVDLQDHQPLRLEQRHLSFEQVLSEQVIFAKLCLGAEFPELGRTLQQFRFRTRYKLMVLGIWREGQPIFAGVDDVPLEAGDDLLVQGNRHDVDAMAEVEGVQVAQVRTEEVAELNNHLLAIRIPADSALTRKTLGENRLAEAFGLAVLAIVRGDETILMPTADDELQTEDVIFVRGETGNLTALEDLQDLRLALKEVPEPAQLESSQVGLVEAVLSPHSTLDGKNLRQLHFREKYGLNVLAILRAGKPHRSMLQDIPLRFGDALLLHGPWEKLKLLASDPDFLVLAEAIQEAPRVAKAPLALLILVVVLLPVILGWLPIYISAVVGAALMILAGCVSMDEAYRFIEWKAVFLIAGLLPLGIAMQQTGTAQLLAEGVVSLVGAWGPRAVMAAIFTLTSLASQVMPNAAVAVLMAPIALGTAADLGISPYPLMMTVAISASAAFLSPVSHPANVLVLGPGGYHFKDYIKVGIPLTLIVMVIVLLVLPLLWPL